MSVLALALPGAEEGVDLPLALGSVGVTTQVFEACIKDHDEGFPN